jgi:Zinc finger, C2H2 type
MSAAAISSPFCCSICNLSFSKSKASRKHKQRVHPRCKLCKKRFLGLKELQNHQQETGHSYCRECGIYFLDNGKHITHVRNVQHAMQYHCCDCGREYTSQESLNNHCCECDKIFRYQRQLKKHLTKGNHIRNVTVPGLQPNADLQHKCEACDEIFRNKKSLRRHMSSKHKPPRHIPCPVGGKCSKKFATPPALLNHLESGRCSSGMTRAKMNELVFAHDPNRYITSIEAAMATSAPVQESVKYNPYRFSSAEINCASQPPNSIAAPLCNLLADESTPLPLTTDDDTASEWSIVGGVLLTPTTSECASDWSIIRAVPLTPGISDDASEWSFMSGNLIYTPSDGSEADINLETAPPKAALPRNLRCHLCPPNRKAFGSVRAFQAHATSAAHAPKIFYCPLSFMPNVKPEDLLKRRYFSTLGGLTQHLESGGCEGGVEMYRKAIKFVEEQLNCLGFRGMRLLLD